MFCVASRVVDEPACLGVLAVRALLLCSACCIAVERVRERVRGPLTRTESTHTEREGASLKVQFNSKIQIQIRFHSFFLPVLPFFDSFHQYFGLAGDLGSRVDRFHLSTEVPLISYMEYRTTR